MEGLEGTETGPEGGRGQGVWSLSGQTYLIFLTQRGSHAPEPSTRLSSKWCHTPSLVTLSSGSLSRASSNRAAFTMSVNVSHISIIIT